MFEHLKPNTEVTFENPKPDVGADLPLWRCHKIVRAAKITSVEQGPAESDINQVYLDGGWIAVSAEWIERNSPEAGGYFVQYEDGYQSYSPAEPFENGYTLLEKAVLLEEQSATGCDSRPNDPDAIEPKAPLAEAESILSWLKTQPSTPENKALRAQASIVVDYLKAK